MANEIETMMDAGMEQLRDMIDVNTVVGDMIVTESGAVVLPVSRINMGFVCGGAQYNCAPIKRTGEQLDAECGYPLAGCTAAGLSLTPTAFLCVSEGNVKLLSMDCDSTADRLVQLIPNTLEMLLNAVRDLCANKDKGGEAAQTK